MISNGNEEIDNRCYIIRRNIRNPFSLFRKKADIEPCPKNGSVDLLRNRDTAVEAGTAGVEPFQPVK
jgi:hypothetical protein